MQHCIPVFVDDDGFTINESSAIIIYLAEKYDKSGTLYPKDIKIRTRINQRMAFNMTSLLIKYQNIVYPLKFGVEEVINQKNVLMLREYMGYLETYLKESKTTFIVGTEAPTLADICLFATYTSIGTTGDLFVKLDDFPVAKKWAEVMETTFNDYGKANGDGIISYKNRFAGLWEKLRTWIFDCLCNCNYTLWAVHMNWFN